MGYYRCGDVPLAESPDLPESPLSPCVLKRNLCDLCGKKDIGLRMCGLLLSMQGAMNRAPTILMPVVKETQQTAKIPS